MILKHRRPLKAIDSLCHAKVCKFFIFMFHFIYCLFYHSMIFCKNNENRLNTDYYKRIIQNYTKCIHLSIIT